VTAVWETVVPADELDMLAARGYGSDVTLGDRPCLIVVDVVMSFLGRRPGDVDGTDYVTGCGAAGWDRLPRIVEVLEDARAAGIPRVLTKGSPEAAAAVGGAVKLSGDPDMARRTHSAGFPQEIVPGQDEFVLEKTKASAFFSTPLLTWLHQRQIDSLVIVGATTSGCVRATTVDASSYGFPTVVVEDACFDRSEFAHAANLFDIQMKYGSVVTTAEAVSLLQGVGTRS
jgi:nicotinamidase-related amidase